MLIKGSKRLIFFVCSLLGLIIIILQFYNENWIASVGHWTNITFSADSKGHPSQGLLSTGNLPDAIQKNIAKTHRTVYSVSTADQKYFPIVFGQQEALNPNIIPHPTLNDTWIIVAVKSKSPVENSVWAAELVCNAVFKHDTLACVEPPEILPIAATEGDKCVGDLGYFSFNIGPHDARVFYGPTTPYAIYGSNSMLTCFGQWIQDFRTLTDWGYETFNKEEFRRATELQRPLPYRPVEKNWFLFWDKYNQVYAHYDIVPKRVFAKIEFDGSAGPDLAPFAASSDSKCMEKYLPRVGPTLESIHQTTNSLSITLCNRSDPLCEPNDNNTFILTLFQHKSYFSFHSVYEPYAMLFRPTAPFQIHAMSTKPIWIHGRGPAKAPEGFSKEEARNWSQTEMFYIVSLSWRNQGQRYHGYADDVLFIAFGIEDERTAGIDVVAGDLLMDLGLCLDS